MGQLCKVCSHPKRLEIDRMIVAGSPILRISRIYGMTCNGIRAHAQNHLSRQLVQAVEKKSLTESGELLAQIEEILSKVRAICNRNYDLGRDLLALKALSEWRGTLQLVSQIAMNLHEARALELAIEQTKNREVDDTRSKEFVNRVFDRLNAGEVKLYLALVDRISGERDAPIVEGPPNPPAPKDRYRDAEPVEEEEEEESEETPVLSFRRTK